MLHPAGRVSDVQRRQMTTVLAPNIHNIAIQGSFDDAQALVKAAFNDKVFAARFQLGAANSINWARRLAQEDGGATCGERRSGIGMIQGGGGAKKQHKEDR